MAALDRPHFVRDELLGPEAWSRLVARYGGGDMYVPSSLASDLGRALVQLIGETAAQRLVDYAPKTWIYIQAGPAQVLAARRAEIVAMRARGLTWREIAAVEWPMRYTERSLRRIVANELLDICPGSIEDPADA